MTSPSSLIKKSEQAHEMYNLLVGVLRGAREKVVQGGKLLYYLKRDNLYKKALGEGMEKWEDFLSQAEIGLSNGEATRMMEIYEWFILELGHTEEQLVKVPVKSLHYLLPIAKSCELTKEEMDELVEDAKHLSQQDLKDRVGDIKYPDIEFEYEYMIMKKNKQTGSLRRVYEITNEQIKEKFDL